MSRRHACAIVAIWLLGGVFGQAEDAAPLKSGLQVGDTVPQFYVRAVTGPLRNKSVCYVCRNGDRPVVMVFARQVGPELRKLLKELDGVVDRHRADGLRCFGVFVAADSRALAPQLQTLSFDENLSVPLTLAVTSDEGPAGQNLDREAEVTVVLYRDLTVQANFAFRKDSLTDDGRMKVLKAAEKLATDE